MIRFDCRSCGATLRVRDDKAGRRGKCPKCGNIISVPLAPAGGGPAKVPGGSASVGPKIDTGLDGSRVVEAMKRERAGRDAGARQCDLCGQPIAYGRVNCPHCGALQRETAAAGKAGVAGGVAATSAELAAVCLSCRSKLPAGARICPRCDIRIPSGRPVLMSRAMDRDVIERKIDEFLRRISWVVRLGLYPVYSDAPGRSRPYVTWLIAAVTVLISMCALVPVWKGSGMPEWARVMMLWPTKARPEEMPPWAQLPPERRDMFSRELTEPGGQVLAERVAMGRYEHLRTRPGFRGRQLLTHALLHGDLMHLAGNLVFLLVFGTRVNALIGNIATLILYPILAILAAWVYLMCLPEGAYVPMIGASGAIMGMAGAYLLLFPLHKVYVAIWLRRGQTVSPLSRLIFPLWGFVMVGFYIAFDVLYVVLRTPAGLAHWAHLGGLIAGLTVAAGLLVSRLVHTGADALSLILGKRAWGLIGTPESHVGRKPMLGLW